VPNFSEPVSTSFLGLSVALLLVVIALGIYAVKKFKKEV
jgi:flagellar biogenesis protein FliO